MNRSQSAAKAMASARQVGLFFVLKHIQPVIDLINIMLDASEATMEGFEEFFVLGLLCRSKCRLTLRRGCRDGWLGLGVA